MKAIPATSQMLDIAPRIIWFETPERALSDPIRFMAYAMAYARHEDMRVIRQYVSDDEFREALDKAPPGIIDPRSWAYWNSKMGRYPAPPLPKRRFGNTNDSTALPQPAVSSSRANPSSRRDLEQVRREGREGWLKMRQQQPQDSLEGVRRRAREDWVAKHGRDKKS